MKKNDSMLIKMLTEAYTTKARILREQEENIAFRPDHLVQECKNTVKRMDYAMDSLSEQDKFIIINEVRFRKERKWYLEYMSPATYYRHRNKAYKAFIRCLD